MLNLPGNSGKFFGASITFYVNEGVMTFIQDDKCQAVRGTDPIKYLNSPYYPAINGKSVPFVKPQPRFVGEYEFTGLNVDFVMNMLLGDELELFKKEMGTDYFTTGKINSNGRAIKWWNANKIKNMRLQTVIYNAILQFEFDNISRFQNRELAEIPVPEPPVKLDYEVPNCKCTTTPVTRFKTLFGVLWPLARKQIHTGFEFCYNSQYSSEFRTFANYKCICLRQSEYDPLIYRITVVDKNDKIEIPIYTYYDSKLERFDKSDKIYTVETSIFRSEFPLSNRYGSNLRLVTPEKKNIPGLPWDITAPFNYQLNDTNCHLEVLQARGGEFFKANLENFKEKNSMKLTWDVTGLISFAYFRKATIINPKLEFALAKFVMNAEYQDYIMNFLIDTDLYLYYKLKKI